MRISLELVAGEGFDPPRLGGNVEILLGTSTLEILRMGNISSLMPTAGSWNPGKLSCECERYGCSTGSREAWPDALLLSTPAPPRTRQGPCGEKEKFSEPPSSPTWWRGCEEEVDEELDTGAGCSLYWVALAPLLLLLLLLLLMQVNHFFFSLSIVFLQRLLMLFTQEVCKCGIKLETFKVCLINLA